MAGIGKVVDLLSPKCSGKLVPRDLNVLSIKPDSSPAQAIVLNRCWRVLLKPGELPNVPPKEMIGVILPPKAARKQITR